MNKKIVIIFNIIFTLILYLFILIRMIYPLMPLSYQLVFSIVITFFALIVGLFLFGLMEYYLIKRITISKDNTHENTTGEYKMEYCKLETFGKAHFSLLIYVESRCVDQNGVFEINNIRVNSTKHPLFSGWEYGKRATWEQEFGTLLNTGERLVDHDDIDCLDDLDAAGLIEIISLVNGFMSMTDKGNKLVSKIRSFKAYGGQLKDFSLETENE